jgi:hypothetical protein
MKLQNKMTDVMSVITLGIMALIATALVASVTLF